MRNVLTETLNWILCFKYITIFTWLNTVASNQKQIIFVYKLQYMHSYLSILSNIMAMYTKCGASYMLKISLKHFYSNYSNYLTFVIPHI